MRARPRVGIDLPALGVAAATQRANTRVETSRGQNHCSDVKRAVFGRLDAACPARAILATNSSSIRAAALEDVTRRPDRVLNAHFCATVWERPMVEPMRGTATSDETVARVWRFCLALGLTHLLVRTASTGFLFNRVQQNVNRSQEAGPGRPRGRGTAPAAFTGRPRDGSPVPGAGAPPARRRAGRGPVGVLGGTPAARRPQPAPGPHQGHPAPQRLLEAQLVEAGPVLLRVDADEAGDAGEGPAAGAGRVVRRVAHPVPSIPGRPRPRARRRRPGRGPRRRGSPAQRPQPTPGAPQRPQPTPGAPRGTFSSEPPRPDRSPARAAAGQRRGRSGASRAPSPGPPGGACCCSARSRMTWASQALRESPAPWAGAGPPRRWRAPPAR